jgi:hypothetical protein
MPRKRRDDPSAAFECLCALPDAPNGSTLAMGPALSGKFRFEGVMHGHRMLFATLLMS